MFLKTLKLKNWRSYDEVDFNFEGGVNVIVGENARGKTNVLEAIAVIATTKSFRSNRDRILVKKDEDFAKIVGVFESVESEKIEEVRLVFERNCNLKKSLYLDGVRVRALDVLGQLSVVVFSPDEIDNFYSMPSQRRRWVDLVLSVSDPDYAYSAAVYKKVVVNRNKLLKRIFASGSGQEELRFWDDRWLDLSEKIIKKRREYIDFVSKNVGEFYNRLFGREDLLSLDYEQTYGGGDLRDGLALELEKNCSRELRNGSTMTGPHREDFVVKMDGVVLADWGSRAQARLGLLSLKLSESEYVKKVGGEYPVLLLDDIFSELDNNNKGRVLEYVRGRQVIITATSLEGVGDLEKFNIIEV